MSDEAIHLLGLPKAHFGRELLDALSWYKLFSIPFMNTNQSSVTPVIAKGSYTLLDPKSVIRYQNKYYVYYMAILAGVCTIKVRESSDGVNWSNEQTCLTCGGGGTWDSINISGPSVIYDPFEPSAYKFKMWYDGYDGSQTRCGFAYSNSPNSGWTKSAQNPLNMPTGSGRSIVRVGNIYYGAYRDASLTLSCMTCPNVGYNDTQTWTFQNVIIGLGSAGEWDAYAIANISVTYIYGVFYATYQGLASASAKYKVGIVYSWNPFATYVKYPLNPIIQSQNANNNVGPCPFIQFERGFKFYYRDEYTQGIHLITIP